ncbi:MAG: hypothetical protein HOI88_07870 [Phycisphaerae bacterium]|nr:hypothetical protein [Phycisphaerae bacterium]MBT6270247.1 hypothetical protein [Phycisphaerae bacterium]MBT6282330.1 hypothetical protein [Phycisphaerae bacterium]
MFTYPTVLISFVVAISSSKVVHAQWNLQIYNAIKWTAGNQGKNTISYTTFEGITRVPLAYHGGVDTDASGKITDRNINQFTNWVRETISSDYCGPIVLDYEQPWWKELSDKNLDKDTLQEILTVYIEGAQVAKQVHPNAQWGYWGLPSLRSSGPVWTECGLSFQALTSQSAALYPDIYNGNPNNELLEQTRSHIEKVLKLANGKIPVYVFSSPRFTGQHGDHSQFIPDDVFLRKANAALQASWIDESGVQHRIQGIILWDSYSFSEESEWNELDDKHKHYFQLLQALKQAWCNSMQGIAVETDLPSCPSAQYGLSEPQNSLDTLRTKNQGVDATNIHSTRKNPAKENDRVSSGRVPSDRVTE